MFVLHVYLNCGHFCSVISFFVHIFSWLLWGWLSVPLQSNARKVERLQSDLLCFEWDVKLNSQSSVTTEPNCYRCCYVVVAVIDLMTSSAKLKLNMKPEQSGYIMPKIFLDVDFKEILVELAKSQVCGGIFHPGWRFVHVWSTDYCNSRIVYVLRYGSHLASLQVIDSQPPLRIRSKTYWSNWHVTVANIYRLCYAQLFLQLLYV